MARWLDAFKCLISRKITAAHLPPAPSLCGLALQSHAPVLGLLRRLRRRYLQRCLLLPLLLNCIKHLTREENRTKGNKTLWITLVQPFLPFDLLNKAPIYSVDKTWLFTNTSYCKSDAVNPPLPSCVMEGVKRHRNRCRKNLKMPFFSVYSYSCITDNVNIVVQYRLCTHSSILKMIVHPKISIL